MSSILKVDQLQDSGGNALITSDGSGNITTQKLLYPAFEAYLSADQSVSSDTDTKVQANTEIFLFDLTVKNGNYEKSRGHSNTLNTKKNVWFFLLYFVKNREYNIVETDTEENPVVIQNA